MLDLLDSSGASPSRANLGDYNTEVRALIHNGTRVITGDRKQRQSLLQMNYSFPRMYGIHKEKQPMRTASLQIGKTSGPLVSDSYGLQGDLLNKKLNRTSFHLEILQLSYWIKINFV